MYLIIFVLLLILSAFFSGSETAFLSLDKIRLRQIEDMDLHPARRVISLLTDPHKLLITILVGNTLVNVAASAILAEFFYSIMGERGIGFSIIAMTPLVLTFGEVTPKMFALTNNRMASFFSSLPLKFLEKIFAPLRIILSATAHTIVKGLGIKVSSKRPHITEQEIKSLLLVGKKQGVVKEKEKDMIDSILELKELDAADVMTPRIDIIALDLTEEKEELIRRIKESQKSRLPVYIHTLDNVVGVLHSKDFLLSPEDPIKNHIRQPFFVPESMKIDDLLKELQRHHVHMAIVTDEYGVTSGVVTVEDILEEIVGEIRDEFDIEAPMVRKIDQRSYKVDGQAHIDRVNEEIGLGIMTEEVDTIGGYVILRLGRIPRSGDRIKERGFLITVNDVSKNRVTRLTIEREPED